MSRERGSTIDRVLDILEQIARSEKQVTATELNDLLGLPKSTAHRLCSTMEQKGFLQKHLDGKRYLPGPRLRSLAAGVLAHSQLRIEHHAILAALSADIGETCNLSFPDGSEMIYADRVETRWPLRLQLTVGTRVPLYSTSAGKMYLATLPLNKRRRVVSQIRFAPFTENTITDPERLLQDLAEIRARNYSVDREEYVEGMIAVAVPIRHANGHAFGTVSFHAPVARMQVEKALVHVPRLHQAAEGLAAMVEEPKERLTTGSNAAQQT